MKALALTLLLAVAALGVQDGAPDMSVPSEPLEQHEWLQQLVGEWAATYKTSMEPGADPMSMESVESVRSLGDLWVVAEASADFEGTAFTSLMTLGYDPQKEAFVGTWIDTLHTHLWSYVGRLDDARKVLTLETTGPSMEDPSKTSSYRDVIEVKSTDHRVMRSSKQGPDGTWTTFMTAEYRRKP